MSSFKIFLIFKQMEHNNVSGLYPYCKHSILFLSSFVTAFLWSFFNSENEFCWLFLFCWEVDESDKIFSFSEVAVTQKKGWKWDLRTRSEEIRKRNFFIGENEPLEYNITTAVDTIRLDPIPRIQASSIWRDNNTELCWMILSGGETPLWITH